MNIIGEVDGKTCVLIDDMVDTAGTLCLAAGALKEKGAKRVVAYITHPVLSGPAVDRIGKSELDELVVTDTIPLSEAGAECARFASSASTSCWPRRCAGSASTSPSAPCISTNSLGTLCFLRLAEKAECPRRFRSAIVPAPQSKVQPLSGRRTPAGQNQTEARDGSTS